MKMNFRIHGIEVRTCNTGLNTDEHNTAEIVKWKDNNCITIAHWIKDREGFNLQFIGNRPLTVDPRVFMSIVKVGQDFLDNIKDLH